ncbi:pilus assembly protein [Rhizobium sp. 32-5/1]|uniref:TadE/TadG family type IV pilus assembly protein n=1 Tax=Rhizobium sp. 32-5/1 TaxID=3019602 RepID=UPI00240E6D1E|nr:TadE/TadG family type IV pilus assembly protein [Rhizobium sp. 32-5/1]WEZ84858.1 pilus assembly protein [Rhizobium sp. 32-5/1]
MMIGIRDRLAKISELSKILGAFGRDRKGTGAIEFAIIAPILIMTYIGAFEVSLGFNVARKVARASSTVADIVTQQTEVNKAFLDSMKDVASGVMTPYGGAYSLKITGIKVTAAGVGVVMWSRDEKGNRPYETAAIIAIPKDLPILNSFVVRTEMVVPHELLLFAPNLSSQAQTINLSKTYYYRQRIGEEITCKDCNS